MPVRSVSIILELNVRGDEFVIWGDSWCGWVGWWEGYLMESVICRAEKFGNSIFESVLSSTSIFCGWEATRTSWDAK